MQAKHLLVHPPRTLNPHSSGRAAIGWTALLVTLIGIVGCSEAATPPTKPATAASATAAASATHSSAPPFSGQPSSTQIASAQPGPPSATGNEPAPPSNEDSWVVNRQDAKGAGVGLSVSGLSNQGWTRIQGPDLLMGLSGPPGGPLRFEVHPYTDAVTVADLHKTFEAMVTARPVLVGSPEKFTIAGGPRDAQAFRTGASFGTTGWCLIRIPAKDAAKTGLLVVMHYGVPETQAPSCSAVAAAAALKPIVKSLALRP